MTRKQATKLEKILKVRGVYKPYVYSHEFDASVMAVIESYPLTAKVWDTHVLLLDRKDQPLESVEIHIGQDHLAIAAQLILKYHAEAYAAAKAWEASLMAA